MREWRLTQWARWRNLPGDGRCGGLTLTPWLRRSPWPRCWLLAAGCGSRDTLPLETPFPWPAGVWALESFSVDGVESEVDVGVNTASAPWVRMSDGVTGMSGCNDFQARGVEFAEGILIFDGIIMTAGLCGYEDTAGRMAAEHAFMTAFAERGAGIRVDVSGDRMTWSTSRVRLVFISVEAPPQPPPLPPVRRMGRLNCSPGVLVEERVDAAGQDPEALIRQAAPEVSTIEAEPPSFWWGYDEAGVVVAGLGLGDTVPAVYQVWTCTGSSPAG